MSRSNFALALALLVVFSLLSPTLVHAQYRTSIQGVVTDPTGAVVPGATLTLTNPATGQKQVRTSNDVGVYNFNALAAARFRLEVGGKGFKKKVLDNVELIPEQANALNVELEVGTASQTVNVDASMAPAIDTQTASVNGVVSSNQIQHMPSFGRDVLKLAQLAPGIFADGSQAGGGAATTFPGTQSGPAPSGGATESSRLKTLPRLSPMATRLRTTAFRLTASAPPAPSGAVLRSSPLRKIRVENVKIVTNSYDAEDGRFSRRPTSRSLPRAAAISSTAASSLPLTNRT